MMALIGFAVTVEMLCCRWSVDVSQAPSNSVRKAFCGSGRAKKPEVWAECLRRGWKPQDDNAADALALMDYAVLLYYPRDYRRSYRTVPA